MKYDEAISARNSTWKPEARKLIEAGDRFVIVHLAPKDIRDCEALAQEFDYTCLHEDEPVRKFYPEVMPSKLGFVRRTSVRRISN